MKKSGKFNQVGFEEKLENLVYYNLLPLLEQGIYDRSPVDETFLKTVGKHQELARVSAEESMVLLRNDFVFCDVPTGQIGSRSIKPAIEAKNICNFLIISLLLKRYFLEQSQCSNV